MSNGGSYETTDTSRLAVPEANEIARTFQENPIDATALLRLCAHYLAEGEHRLVQGAIETHLSSASGGPAALRLRVARTGELPPDQRAMLLLELSHVEATRLGDAQGAIASLREALEADPDLALARERLEALAQETDPVQLALDDTYLIETRDRAPSTDSSLSPSPGAGKHAWGSAGETDPDIESTIKLPSLPPIEATLPDQTDPETPRPDQLKLFDGESSNEWTGRIFLDGPISSLEPHETNPQILDTACRATTAGLDGISTVQRLTKQVHGLPLDDCLHESEDLPASQPHPMLAQKCASLADKQEQFALEELAALECACTSPADRALVQRTVSHVYETLGDRDRAFAFLALASTTWTPDRALLDELFRLAMITGSYTELVRVYEDALNRDLSKADQVYLHLKLGHLNARELARPKQAICHYEQVSALDPNNLEALRRLGDLMTREQNWQELAEVKHKELETVWRTTRDLGRAASVKRELARIYEEHLDDRHKALLLYRELLELTPGNPNAIASLERMFQSQGSDDTTAQSAFETLRDLYRRQGAYGRLAELLSRKASEASQDGQLLDSVASHREAARTYEELLNDPGRAFAELVCAAKALAPDDDTETEGIDPESLAASMEELFEELLRTGRKARAHHELMDIGEKLALRLKGTRGASMMSKLVDAELEDIGGVGQAPARLARAVELSGNDPVLEARLEGLYVSRESWVELAAFYRARASRVRDIKAKTELLFRLAEILEDEIGDLEDAARVYEEIIELDDGNPDALSALFRLLEAEGCWKTLVDALGKTLAFSKRGENRKPALLKRAKVHLEKLQDVEAARADWREVLAIDSKCVEALQGMAETASAQGDARETAEALTRRLSGMRLGEAGRADGYRRLARLSADVLDDRTAAKHAWSEVIKEAPEDEEAFERLKTIYTEEKEIEPLARLLGEKLRSKPHHPDSKRLRRERISALEQLGLQDDVADEWWYAAQTDPTDLEAYSRLTSIHSATGNWKVVLRILEDWLAATTSAPDKANLYFRTGEIQRDHLEDEILAISAFEKALARDPDHAESENALLDLYRKWNELPRIIQLLEARLRRAGEPRARTKHLLDIWESARRLGQQGDPNAGSRAMEALKEACLLSPDNQSIWQTLEESLDAEKMSEELASLLEARSARQEGSRRAHSLMRAAKIWQHSENTGKERAGERARRCLERARDAAPPDHPVMREVLEQLRKTYTSSSAWEALASVLLHLASPPLTSNADDLKSILQELSWVLIERVGRPLEAVDHLETLLGLGSSDSERDGVLARLVTLHSGLGDWEQVLSLVEERIRLHRGKEREPDLRLVAAEIAYRRLSKHDVAIEHVKAVLSDRPGDENTLAWLERTCSITGRLADCLEIFEEEARRASDPSKRTLLEGRLTSIKEKLLAEQQMKASRELEARLAQTPRDPDTLLSLAAVYEESERWAETIEMRSRLIAISTSDTERRRLSLEIAELLTHNLRDFGMAARVLSKTLQAHPNDPELLSRLAEAQERAGAYRKATDSLSRLLKLSPSGGPARLWVKLGRLSQEQLGDCAQAMAAYRRALEQAREPLEVSEALSAARDLVASTRDAKSLVEVLEFLANRGGAPGLSRSSILREIAEVRRYQLGDRAGAIATLERVVRLEPDDITAMEDLARLYEREGRDDEAVHALRRVLHISPFDVDAYRALLRVMRRRQEMDAAALIASLLVLLEEADEETKALASTLERPLAGGPPLPDGHLTPGLMHPDALGPIYDVLLALGRQSLLLFETLAPTDDDQPLERMAGPMADRSAAAIGLAAKAFGVEPPEICMGPTDMPIGIASCIGARPKVVVSANLLNGTRSMPIDHLQFLAGRAVISTLPPLLAARALLPEQIERLMEVAVTMAGLETRPSRETARLTQRLQALLGADCPPELEKAARALEATGRQYHLQAYLEAVEHTSIRAGLLLCGSPEMAVRVLRDEGRASRSNLRELVRFSISKEHLELRHSLEWNADRSSRN